MDHSTQATGPSVCQSQSSISSLSPGKHTLTDCERALLDRHLCSSAPWTLSDMEAAVDALLSLDLAHKDVQVEERLQAGLRAAYATPHSIPGCKLTIDADALTDSVAEDADALPYHTIAGYSFYLASVLRAAGRPDEALGVLAASMPYVDTIRRRSMRAQVLDDRGSRILSPYDNRVSVSGTLHALLLRDARRSGRGSMHPS